MNKDRRSILALTGFAAASCLLPRPILAATSNEAMDTFTCLSTRRSVRAYTDEPVSDADIQKMLEMAMLAPSAANEQPWDFVVIRDKSILDKIGEINHYAAYAAHAPLAILVCLNEAKVKIKDMALLDIGMCSENLMLAAHALGLGSVFTGIWPEKDRMDGFAKLVNLPQDVQPIGLIVIGHPKIAGLRTAEDRFKKSAIHYDKWQNNAD